MLGQQKWNLNEGDRFSVWGFALKLKWDSLRSNAPECKWSENSLV